MLIDYNKLKRTQKGEANYPYDILEQTYHKGVFFSKVKVERSLISGEPPTFKKCFGKLLTKYTNSFDINAK